MVIIESRHKVLPKFRCFLCYAVVFVQMMILLDKYDTCSAVSMLK